jgi:hypothetical protein
MMVLDSRVRYGMKMETVYFHDNVDEYKSDKDIVQFYAAAQFPKSFHYGCVTYTMMEDLTWDENALLAKMRYRTRNRIHKAMAMDALTVEVVEKPVEKDFIEFFKHYNRFAANMNLNVGSMKYVNELNEKCSVHIMYVKYNHQDVLSAMIFFKTQDLGFLSYGFANFRLYEEEEMSKLSSLANLKMYWSGLLHCRKAGCKVLDYGGLGHGIYDHKLDNIDHFKEGFHGKIVQQHSFYKAYTWKGQLFVWLMKATKRNLYSWQK